jgi:hypothetical protein
MAANNEERNADETTMSIRQTGSANQGGQEDVPVTQSSSQEHVESSEAHQLNPLLPPIDDSHSYELNDSLEDLARHGSAAERRSVEALPLSALGSALPSSDAASESLIESIDSVGNGDETRYLLLDVANLMGSNSMEMHEMEPDMQSSTTQFQENHQEAYSYPPLPPSTRASSQYTTGSSLQNLLAWDPEIVEHDPSAAEEAANIPLPPASSSVTSLLVDSTEEAADIALPPTSSPVTSLLANSLEDLSQVGYGRMSYIERVREMAQYLPQLKCIYSQPRNNHAGQITWYDYTSTGNQSQGIVSNLYEGHNKEQIFRLRAKLRSEIPPDVHTRVVVVSDLSMTMIDFLGTSFDVSPECFAEHLNNSGYENGTFDDQDPWLWKTAGINKDYVSASWLRPITRSSRTTSPVQLTKLLDPDHNGLQWTEKRVVEQGRKRYPITLHHYENASTNIVRPEFPLDMTSDAGGNEPSSWRERATIWCGIVGMCQIGKILLLCCFPYPVFFIMLRPYHVASQISI